MEENKRKENEHYGLMTETYKENVVTECLRIVDDPYAFKNQKMVANRILRWVAKIKF